MKLITYDYRGVARVGVYVGDKIAHIARLSGILGDPVNPATMVELIENWDELGPKVRAHVAEAEKNTGELAPVLMDPAEVSFMAPVPNPGRNVLCMGLNYTDHVNEGLKAKDVKTTKVEYDAPMFFTKAPSTLIGHGEGIPRHNCSEKYDYEAEISVIIGKRGINIPADKVYDHIFGYCCGNDISARDTQAREMSAGLGPGKGKDFETGNIIGPCIVTGDAFDPYNADMIVRINGEERSRGNSRDMHWKFEDCIAHTSQAETVYPGEFFCSGTVPWGCGLEHDLYLSDGDVVELEVTGIGVLKNRVVKQK